MNTVKHCHTAIKLLSFSRPSSPNKSGKRNGFWLRKTFNSSICSASNSIKPVLLFVDVSIPLFVIRTYLFCFLPAPISSAASSVGV
ncbi:hypothetical protein [Mastigocoleus testarum]|uniref:hypothetical protein n=1 Tax=Mastigocoleus testarum TaxID=996925 RepID=UPI00137A9E86|nr:hypothetical protein [Mastigocoleus testarum]